MRTSPPSGSSYSMRLARATASSRVRVRASGSGSAVVTIFQPTTSGDDVQVVVVCGPSGHGVLQSARDRVIGCFPAYHDAVRIARFGSGDTIRRS